MCGGLPLGQLQAMLANNWGWRIVEHAGPDAAICAHRRFPSGARAPPGPRLVLANAAEFTPAAVTAGEVGSAYEVSPEDRIALTSKKLGPLEPMLTSHLLGALDRIVAGIGTRLTPQSLDLELSAYGDGAFFAPHTDVSTGINREPLSGEPGQDRVLSAVYYFHRQPKAFSDGALRLFRFGAGPAGAGLEAANHIDLEPIDNSLVAFPSTVIHEVRPVQVPTGNFEDYRFALNCWYCRTL